MTEPKTPAWATTEPGAIVFLDEFEDGLTEEEIYALFSPGPPLDDEGNLVAAANVDATTGEIHTGAMIALVPSTTDAQRLVVEGGELLEQLHLTLVYLGEAADIDDDSRDQLLQRVRSFVDDVTGPIVGNAFGIAAFNPTGDEPCVVMLVGSSEGFPLDDVHEAAIWAAEESSIDTSLSKRPWIPHITLMYVNDGDGWVRDMDEIEQRVGPIVFDRIRVAFGGEIHDFSFNTPRG